MTYLEKVEPYILSDDSLLQKFVLGALHESYCATEETFFKGLEANKRATHQPYTNKILPYLYTYPKTDNVFKEILVQVKENKGNDDQFVFLAAFINQADPCLVSRHKEEVLEALQPDDPNVLNHYLELCQDSAETLWERLAEIVAELNSKKEHDQDLFKYGEVLVKALVQKGPLDLAKIQEGLHNGLQKDESSFISYDTIYFVKLAGESCEPRFASALIQLFEANSNNDFFLEVVGDAFVKIGTEEVVELVKPYLSDEDLGFHAIGILEKIKKPFAEKALLDAFDQIQDRTFKTTIADALCEHLSVDAIPKVEAFIETGYDTMLTDLVEALYCNCVINGVEHPKLKEWKKEIDDMNRGREKRAKSLENVSIGSSQNGAKMAVKSEKIGRNDPCPCGSGKKYKKCCGK